MTPKEAKEIIIKERDGLKANPMVKVEDCLYEAFDMAIKVLEIQACKPNGEDWEGYADRLYDLAYQHGQEGKEPCEDCISREAVLEVQIKYAEHMGATKYWQMRDDIRALSPVTPKTRWIPVSERLPEPNRLVLCYITTGATKTYFLAFWNDIQNAWEEGIGGCRLLRNDLEYEVIAWMPLPQPYKAESEEEE